VINFVDIVHHRNAYSKRRFGDWILSSSGEKRALLGLTPNTEVTQDTTYKSDKTETIRGSYIVAHHVQKLEHCIEVYHRHELADRVGRTVSLLSSGCRESWSRAAACEGVFP
jgi:hypothetical protein